MNKSLNTRNNIQRKNKDINKKQKENIILFMIIYILYYLKHITKSMRFLSDRKYFIATERDILQQYLVL